MWDLRKCLHRRFLTFWQDEDRNGDVDMQIPKLPSSVKEVSEEPPVSCTDVSIPLIYCPSHDNDPVVMLVRIDFYYPMSQEVTKMGWWEGGFYGWGWEKTGVLCHSRCGLKKNTPRNPCPKAVH